MISTGRSTINNKMKKSENTIVITWITALKLPQQLLQNIIIPNHLPFDRRWQDSPKTRSCPTVTKHPPKHADPKHHRNTQAHNKHNDPCRYISRPNSRDDSKQRIHNRGRKDKLDKKAQNGRQNLGVHETHRSGTE